MTRERRLARHRWSAPASIWTQGRSNVSLISAPWVDNALIAARCRIVENEGRMVAMKKTYEKPVLTKREKLSTVIAQQVSPPPQ